MARSKNINGALLQRREGGHEIAPFRKTGEGQEKKKGPRSEAAQASTTTDKEIRFYWWAIRQSLGSHANDRGKRRRPKQGGGGAKREKVA